MTGWCFSTGYISTSSFLTTVHSCYCLLLFGFILCSNIVTFVSQCLSLHHVRIKTHCDDRKCIQQLSAKHSVARRGRFYNILTGSLQCLLLSFLVSYCLHAGSHLQQDLDDEGLCYCGDSDSEHPSNALASLSLSFLTPFYVSFPRDVHVGLSQHKRPSLIQMVIYSCLQFQGFFCTVHAPFSYVLVPLFEAWTLTNPKASSASLFFLLF